MSSHDDAPAGRGPRGTEHGTPPPPYPQYGAPQAPYPPRSGWYPPLQPGIVPLAPLRLGDYVTGLIGLVRTHAKLLFTVAAIAAVPALALTGLSYYLSYRFQTDGTDWFTAADVLVLGVGVLVLWVVSAYLTCALVAVAGMAGARASMGQVLTGPEVRSSLRQVTGTLLGVTGLYTLAGIVFGIPLLALLAGPMLALGEGSDASRVVAMLVGLGVYFLALIPLMYLSARVAPTPVVVALERDASGAPLSAWQAVRRAWRLTRGQGWRLAGITLLVGMVVSTVATLVVTPVSVLGALAGPAASLVAGTLTTGLLLVAVLPLQSAVPALAYLDMRMRTEDLGGQIARQTGLA